ncbi:uncharacterized protein KD926_001361 [Aspergillus affinis]|uniref:uncharacterized protein n=1 Tax=Aspergillus affinis TaxID=1070780 RepID=UPI0022FF3740|nr:uncharacterized protein KD926_001361 [Aspergillus affinis]KAI9036727.1 hypothetical protein KD926_001361 [Aspergillus affinis]
MPSLPIQSLPSSIAPSSPLSSSAVATTAPTSKMQTQELAQIELQDRLNLYNIKALHYMRTQRPKNISRAYINKHQEWQKFQGSIGTNSFLNPRRYTVSAFMTGRLHKESERKREQYLDRATGTLQDGYSKDKIKDFWYNFHFFKGLDREKPIPYEIQLKWANEIFNAINLSTDKKTHAGRAQGSKQAELEGDDPIFAREDYTTFAEQIRQSLLCTEIPQEIQLRQTFPIIADRLSILQKDIHQAVDFHGYQAREQLRKIARQLEDLLSGQVTFAVRAIDTGARTPDSFTPSSQLAACLSETSSLQQQLPSQLLPQGINTLSLSLLPSQALYSLSRTIQSVPEVWREWTCGLGANPSIQSLEISYGAAWRPSSREICRQKVIIDEIYARHGKGQSLDAAVEELELVRCRGKLSHYQLSQLLSKAR